MPNESSAATTEWRESNPPCGCRRYGGVVYPCRIHVAQTSLDRIEAEARGEIEWLEARQRRNLEVRERLKWIRRCVRLIEELREERNR